MSPDLDDSDLIVYAALSVCDTLLLVSHVRWPRCVDHPTKYLLPYPLSENEGSNGAHEDRAWWWCNRPKAHRVSAVGELVASA